MMSYQETLIALNLFINELLLGLLRVGDRITNLTVTYDNKHPILLSAKHHLTTLIIRDSSRYSDNLKRRATTLLVDQCNTNGKNLYPQMRCMSPCETKYINVSNERHSKISCVVELPVSSD